jgi:hypothetical protein
MTWRTIVLPGQAYGVDGPALAVPLGVLSDSSVAVVTYASPVAAQVDELASGAERVTFLAKSLGTRYLASLPGRPADAIWVTPLFGDAAVRDGAIASGMRSLIISGGADPTYDAAAVAAVVAALGAVSLVIAGADHGLVGGPDETWLQVEAAVAAFVGA